MNIFRAFGDGFHVLSIFILLYRLLRLKSSKGLSAKTQILNSVVYLTRYLDLLYSYISFYNTAMKAFYIFTSLVILFLIFIKYRETRDKENDTLRIEVLVLVPIALTICVNHGFYGLELLWAFSVYLEMVAILPQFLMICKLENCEAFLFHYIISLTLYRGCYIANWAYKFHFEQTHDFIAIGSGLAQVYIYLDFIFRLRLTSMACRYLNLKTVNIFHYGSSYIVDSSAVNSSKANVPVEQQGEIKIVVNSTL